MKLPYDRELIKCTPINIELTTPNLYKKYIYFNNIRG